MYQSIIIENM